MKKVLSLLPISFAVVFAGKKSYLDVLDRNITMDKIALSATLSYTNAKINKIDNVSIDVKPLLVGGIKAVLFPGDLDISLGYSQVLNQDNAKNSVYGKNEKANQFNIEVPLDKVYLKNFALLADYYQFTTKLRAEDQWLFLAGKSTPIQSDGSIALADVYNTDTGDEFILSTKLLHFEGRHYGIFDQNAYIGVFYETMEKPWQFNGDKLNLSGATLVYTQSKMTMYGLSGGYKMKEKDIRNGFQLTDAGVSVGRGSVKMTNNYDSSSWKSDGIDAVPMKLSANVEATYRRTIPSLKSDFIASIYGWYNHTFLQGKIPAGVDAKISDDYMYGVKVGLNF